MGSVCPVIQDEQCSLEYLLALWPVAESLASHLPVGDLITLSRTNKLLRAGLHGSSTESRTHAYGYEDRNFPGLVPHVGEHQTSYWKHLKHLSPFTCINKMHTKGQKLKPCVYCSRPICDACIVRDSFKKGKEDTFRNRLRFFCRECWTEGKPTKTHRYPAISEHYSNDRYDGQEPSWDGSATNNTDNFCRCTLKDNGWLCIECKGWQNTYGTSSVRQFAIPVQTAQCYAVNCLNQVDLDSSSKDRQRICLWCQKPLRRQYSGEDRHAWNQKTIIARAINAESRRIDMEEYNRKRWRSLRMSRNEMRGHNTTINNPEDDKLDFVRHLDTVNYLGTPHRLTKKENPSPDAVYKSKNGIWRYERGFLLAFGRVSRYQQFQVPNLDTESLYRVTTDGTPSFARTNLSLHDELKTFRGQHHKLAIPAGKLEKFITLRARISNLLTDLNTEGREETKICTIISEQYDLHLTDRIFKRLWSKQEQYSRCKHADQTTGDESEQGGSKSFDPDFCNPHDPPVTPHDKDVATNHAVDTTLPLPLPPPCIPQEDTTKTTNLHPIETETETGTGRSSPITNNPNVRIHSSRTTTAASREEIPDNELDYIPSHTPSDEPPSYLP